MSDNDPATRRLASVAMQPADQGGRDVLQVERRDFVDLVPTDGVRAQPMRGFDPIYTDIVDYIVRCTHRIWDERDIGLIYSHYTHNAAVYYNLGAVHDREAIVRDTIQRLVSFPERRGMATQVIWRGDDLNGFYTSHLVTGVGRHTQHGHLGAPTGRSFTSRTIADCMILNNRIYREWIVSDTMAQLRQLGLDPDPIAAAMAQELHAKGQATLDIGENRRLLGQNPPEAAPDLSIAHTDAEADCLRWLHEAYNRRMLGVVRDVYAPTVLYHGPNMREMVGSAAVQQQMLKLIGTLPDCAFMPQHVCSTPCEEGGEKIAVRWILEGHHLGWSLLGRPTGHRVLLMGVSHFHVVNRRIVEEWTVYDELAMLAQLKLGALGTSPS